MDEDDKEEYQDNHDVLFSRTEFDFIADQFSLDTLLRTIDNLGSMFDDENYDKGLEIEHNVECNHVPEGI